MAERNKPGQLLRAFYYLRKYIRKAINCSKNISAKLSINLKRHPGILSGRRFFKPGIIIFAALVLLTTLTLAGSRPVSLPGFPGSRPAVVAEPDGAAPGGPALVPLRPVFEALGARVSWDEAAAAVVITGTGSEIRLTVGGPALVDGRVVNLTEPVALVDGQVVMPPGLVEELTGGRAQWSGETGILYFYPEKLPAEQSGARTFRLAISLNEGKKTAPYPQRPAPVLKSAAYQYPIWLSKDGRTLYTGLYRKTLSKSGDDLKTFTVIHTFDTYISACRDLDNGELLVATGNEGKPGALWLSSKGRTEWTRVLECSSECAYFTNSWSLSVRGEIVVAAEYGGKTPLKNARKVYLSTDYGVSWREIFDLGGVANTHIHSCAYDPYESRIWVASGDSPYNAVRYSDDWGATWTTASTDLVTSIVPLPDCVLFGAHQPPSGILRYNRKGKGEPPGFEYAYMIDHDLNNVSYCAGMAFQREPGGPVYFSFLVAGVGAKPGLVIATKDAVNFYEVYRDTARYAPGKGVIHVLGPTAGGKLIGLIQDDRQSSHSLLISEAQEWLEAN